MSCKHKFYEYLNLDRLDFEPTTLIVGTFNPEWPEGNYAQWFYGRTNNNYFWEVLPKLYETESLLQCGPAEWKRFCVDKKIAITDLIARIDDADRNNECHVRVLAGYSDSELIRNFREYDVVNIAALIESKPTIQRVYLTTTAELWERWWGPVRRWCQNNNKHCRALLTPSKGARFFMKKGANISMPDFIFNDWESKWRRDQ